MKKTPQAERDRKKVTVFLDHDLWREASIRALDDDSSLQEMLTLALRRYLKEAK